jgi:ATPase subunit of ABC transporter with duplicated ATPase domains
MLYIDIREKTAGAKLLLSDFELRLNTGEKVGLIGRNGSGKTTLFNILLGLDNKVRSRSGDSAGTSWV